MQEEQSLDSILNNEPAPEVEATPVVEAATETQPADGDQPRGPDGKFLTKQPGVEEAAPPADQLPQGEYKAIREEREKRQAAEARAQALEQQLQQKQQPQAQPEPPPSVWDDEQAYGQHLTGRAVSEASFNAQLNTSEMLCRDKFEDFDDKKAKFLEMAQANPVIVQQALADPHPWRRAYQIANNAARIEELGATDLDGLEAKLREKIMAELQGSEPVRQQQTLPPTLTTERNVGARTGPTWSGPPSLTELLR
jgi:hypothetical protein